MKNIINNTIETVNTNTMTEKENTNMTTKTDKRNRPVKCIETGITYPSMTIAAKELNVSYNGLYNVLNGRQNSLKGMHFEYVDASKVPVKEKADAPTDPDIPKEIIIQHKAVVKGKGKRMNGNTKSTFDFTTGSFYTSATDMAEHLNTTQGHISFACRHKGRTVKGHKVCYVRDINEHLDEIGNAIRKANMYDECMTKEEKRREMLALLTDLECKASCIQYEMDNLSNELDKTNAEIEKVKNDLIYFKF